MLVTNDNMALKEDSMAQCHAQNGQVKYSGDPEIGPPMGLTESGPILESVRFVKTANYEWRDTSQSVHRYALLRVDIKVD